MLKKIISLVALSLISFSAMATKPLPESLFRNAENSPLAGDIAMFNFIVREVADNNENTESKTTVMDGSEDSDSPFKDKYVKLIFNVDKKNIQMIQVDYANSSFSKNSEVRKAIFIKNFNATVESASRLESEAFYSVIAMLALRDSAPMTAYLKKINPDFESNMDLMNVEKRNFLKKYERFLAQREAEEVDETLNPMKPTDPEKKAEVDKLMASKMYRASDNVTLIKRGSAFYWMYSIPGIQAVFENNSHQIKKFMATQGDNQFDFAFSDFRKYRNKYSLPEQITFAYGDRKFQVSIVDFASFPNTGKSISERYQEYKELAEKNQEAFGVTIDDRAFLF